MAGHVIVCGMGHLGYRVVSLLLRLGESVTVVTQSARDEWIHEVQTQGGTVLAGDAREHNILTSADLQQARALIITTDQDLVSIEIALDAKRLRPDLPVVVRLFDQHLASQLERTFDIRVLPMSTLAAQTFATAAMGERALSSFTLDGTVFVIGQLTLGPASPLGGLTVSQAGAQYQVATLIHGRGTTEHTVAPSHDTRFCAGDRVVVAGRADDWKAVAHGPQLQQSPLAVWRLWLAGMGEHLHPSRWFKTAFQVWRHIPFSLRSVFVIFNLLILFSVFVFHLWMDLTFVDALYFIITTVTTVGYGDISPRHASTALKLYGCLVMLLGSAAIATLYSIITDFIVTTRFQQLLGRQRIPHKGHIVVVGLGNVGYRTIDELRRTGTQVVAIERNPEEEFVQTVRTYTSVIIGDARLLDTLIKAGVGSASAVIATTDDDAVNLGVGLAAKHLNAGVRTVVRLFDADFAQKVQAMLHIDIALSASMITAPTFVAAALYPDLCTATVSDDRLLIILRRTAEETWHALTPSRLRSEHGVIVLMRQGLPGHGYELADDDRPLNNGESLLILEWRELTGR